MTHERDLDFSGTFTVGGLAACGLSGIVGVLTGEPTRASRDSASPFARGEVPKRWAEEQSDLVPLLWAEPEQQCACAQNIRMCGGRTKRVWPLQASNSIMLDLAGAVIESLSDAWSTTIDEVQSFNKIHDNNSYFRENKQVIGNEGKRQLRASALVIRKPPQK